MLVRFLTNWDLEIVENYDEDNDCPDITWESFKIGDETEFDIFGHPLYINKINPDDKSLEENLEEVNVQFGDGSIAFGIRMEWFEEIGVMWWENFINYG